MCLRKYENGSRIRADFAFRLSKVELQRLMGQGVKPEVKGNRSRFASGS